MKNKAEPTGLYDNELIQQAAKEKEMKPIQVAAAAGKSIPTVYQVYSGESVTITTLNAIVEAVGLSLSDVIRKEIAA